MTQSSNHPPTGEYARGATLLGRYVIDRCVRRDRLASVFAAHDAQKSFEWFSVWSVRGDQVAHTPGSPERFSREMARVRAVKHPSITEAISWDGDGAAPVVVSVMHRGRPLREVIASDAFLSVEDVARIVVSVAEALNALHLARPSIMHLNVCPEGVLIGDDGGVWLEEPGFLHALAQAGYLSTVQAAAHALPGYVVPMELLTPPTPAADTFQLSVLAFEALTGQLPFGAATQVELPMSLRAPVLPSVSSLRPGVGPDVDDVFERLWRGVVTGHHESSLAFARDLARVLGEDRSLRPTFPGGALPESVRRRSRPAITSALQDDVSRPMRVSIVHGAPDAVDEAFDDMLRASEEADSKVPPVIEFAAPTERVEAHEVQAPTPSAPSPVVDVTPVKPTLVGATGVRLSTHPPPPRRSEFPLKDRPPVHDGPTPSVGYERIKLMAPDAEAHPQQHISADATSQIEQELLEVLKRTSVRGRIGSSATAPTAPYAAVSPSLGAAKSLPRAEPRDHAASRRKDELPPPPSHTTRPSTTTTRPRAPIASEKAVAKEHSEIPPPPRLPADAAGMIESTRTPHPVAPRTVRSAGPEVSLVETQPEESGTELSTQDILEDMLPVFAAQASRPPALPPEVSAALHDDDRHASAERTQIAGSPLPPKAPVPAAVTHRPAAATPTHTPAHAHSATASAHPATASARPAVPTHRPPPVPHAAHELESLHREPPAAPPGASDLIDEPPTAPRDAAPHRHDPPPVPHDAPHHHEHAPPPIDAGHHEPPPVPHPAHARPGHGTAPPPALVDPPRPSQRSADAPRASDVPRVSDVPRASETPRNSDIPRVSGVPRASEPTSTPPAPRAPDPTWTMATRFLGTSTIVSSLLVTAGLVYMRSSLESLREEVALYRAEMADAGAQPPPPREEPDAAVATPEDAAEVPSQDASVSLVADASVTPSTARDAAVANVSIADAARVAAASDGGVSGAVPPESVRVRLMGQMRSGINDCIEGVDNPRVVVINVRFDGVTGAVQRVRLHGIFAEPPLGPCIEQVVRRAQTSPFEAPFWDADFRFPVPLPRWRPPM